MSDEKKEGSLTDLYKKYFPTEEKLWVGLSSKEQYALYKAELKKKVEEDYKDGSEK